MPLIRPQQPVFTNTRLTTILEFKIKTLLLLYVEVLMTLGLLVFIEVL